MVNSPRPLRGPFTRWPRTADAVLAVAAFAAEVVANLAARNTEDSRELALRSAADLPILAYLVLAAGCAALYWRRRHATAVLAAVLAVTALTAGAVSPLLPVVISLYSVGRYVAEDRMVFIGLAVAAAVVTIGNIVDGETAAEFGVSLTVAFLPWYVGRRVRIRGEYVEILQERAEYRERERAADTQRAISDERTRIARELHDVVAHRVSMMTVQAGAAKTVAGDDPDGAYRAMEAVEEAGRQALGELRHLLGVLRPGTGAERLGLQPGLAEVPRLVDQLTDTGMEIALTMDGLGRDVSAQVDLSTYRIVQEALTNVLKHAGPQARSEVRLSCDNGVLIVEVSDDGTRGTVLPGSGQGIIGMRERASLLGGSLEAGPRVGGGFRVMARLPIRGATA